MTIEAFRASRPQDNKNLEGQRITLEGWLMYCNVVVEADDPPGLMAGPNCDRQKVADVYFTKRGFAEEGRNFIRRTYHEGRTFENEESRIIGDGAPPFSWTFPEA